MTIICYQVLSIICCMFIIHTTLFLLGMCHWVCIIFHVPTIIGYMVESCFFIVYTHIRMFGGGENTPVQNGSCFVYTYLLCICSMMVYTVDLITIDTPMYLYDVTKISGIDVVTSFSIQWCRINIDFWYMRECLASLFYYPFHSRRFVFHDVTDIPFQLSQCLRDVHDSTRCNIDIRQDPVTSLIVINIQTTLQKPPTVESTSCLGALWEFLYRYVRVTLMLRCVNALIQKTDSLRPLQNDEPVSIKVQSQEELIPLSYSTILDAFVQLGDACGHTSLFPDRIRDYVTEVVEKASYLLGYCVTSSMHRWYRISDHRDLRQQYRQQTTYKHDTLIRQYEYTRLNNEIIHHLRSIDPYYNDVTDIDSLQKQIVSYIQDHINYNTPSPLLWWYTDNIGRQSVRSLSSENHPIYIRLTEMTSGPIVHTMIEKLSIGRPDYLHVHPDDLLSYDMYRAWFLGEELKSRVPDVAECGYWRSLYVYIKTFRSSYHTLVQWTEEVLGNLDKKQTSDGIPLYGTTPCPFERLLLPGNVNNVRKSLQTAVELSWNPDHDQCVSIDYSGLPAAYGYWSFEDCSMIRYDGTHQWSIIPKTGASTRIPWSSVHTGTSTILNYNIHIVIDTASTRLIPTRLYIGPGVHVWFYGDTTETTSTLELSLLIQTDGSCVHFVPGDKVGNVVVVRFYDETMVENDDVTTEESTFLDTYSDVYVFGQTTLCLGTRIISSQIDTAYRESVCRITNAKRQETYLDYRLLCIITEDTQDERTNIGCTQGNTVDDIEEIRSSIHQQQALVTSLTADQESKYYPTAPHGLVTTMSYTFFSQHRTYQ